MQSGSHARTYDAAAAIPPRRIVKFTADRVVGLAAAATDDIIGVSDDVGAAAAGDRVDIFRSGPVEIEVGGAIARGKEVTSDATGKAVQAAPAAGTSCRIIGIAERTYVAGDVGLFELGVASKTTPAV